MLLKKIAVGICASILTAGMASAADLAGKTVEWTIPFSETGGSAKWANFFAPLLSEAMPGTPTVIVKYMPGAGSTKGANWFQQQKHSDGTNIFGSSGSTHFPYLLNDPRVRYEFKDWKTVMASGTGGVAYLTPDDGKLFDGSANKLKGKKIYIRKSRCHIARSGPGIRLGNAWYGREARDGCQGSWSRTQNV